MSSPCAFLKTTRSLRNSSASRLQAAASCARSVGNSPTTDPSSGGGPRARQGTAQLMQLGRQS